MPSARPSSIRRGPCLPPAFAGGTTSRRLKALRWWRIPMKLGIDFGTTRIVAAHADRGNYPLVSFESADGETRDWFPPLIAVRGKERRFGWNAAAVQGDREWTVVRSLK